MDEGTPYRPNFVPRAGTKQGRRVLNPYFRKALSSGPSSDGGLDRIHSVARDQSFSYHDARSPLDVFEGETDKDIEIMVLRHQVRILERQLNARVAYRPVDRAILAALSRLLARRRWRSFLVTPETLLRWHRELSRRKWRRWRSTRGPGRPPCPMSSSSSSSGSPERTGAGAVPHLRRPVDLAGSWPRLPVFS